MWMKLLPQYPFRSRLDLAGADLSGLDLACFELRRCDLAGCDFSECNFAAASLDGWATTDIVAVRANFHQANLRTANLAQAKLTGAIFTQAALSKAVFDHADLREANGEGANLRGASLKNADLRRASFRNANLGDADLTGAKVTGADFTGANLRNVKGLPATRTAKISPATHLLQLEAALMDATGWQLDFALALPPCGRAEVRLGWREGGISRDLSRDRGIEYSSRQDLFGALRELAIEHPGARPFLDTVALTPQPLATQLGALPLLALGEVFGQPFATAEQAIEARRAAEEQASGVCRDTLEGLRLGAAGVAAWNQLDPLQRKALAALDNIDLSRCRLAGLNLEWVHCTGANFDGADLSQASLICANFREASLKGADLSQAKLNSATVPNANLEGANLSRVSASRVVLTGANLEGACLRGARFLYGRLGKANLRSADLTGASFRRASLRGADLTGAIVTDTEFLRAEYDARTTFPAGFDPAGAGMVFRAAAAKKKSGPAAGPPQNTDFAAFLDQLATVADSARIRKAVAMLRAEKFQLFAQADDDRVIGVVRAQSSAERIYACRLTSAGQFECGTQNLRPCAGLHGAVCKHLLVLILGLTKSGQMDSSRALQWLQQAQRQRPTSDKEAMTTTFLKYKGAQAGEVDWRPTETIPEDYYAL
jgi:uncharacterized protein YjbI with pentapeptide repeats